MADDGDFFVWRFPVILPMADDSHFCRRFSVTLPMPDDADARRCRWKTMVAFSDDGDGLPMVIFYDGADGRRCRWKPMPMVADGDGSRWQLCRW